MRSDHAHVTGDTSRNYDGRVSLPDYGFGVVFTEWRFDPVVAGAVAVLGAGYVVAFLRARRHGADIAWWRLAAFLVLGLGGIVICTMSSLAVYQHTGLWAFATQMTLLMSIVPVFLALGDPVEVVRMAGGERWQAWGDRVLHGKVTRVLTFPLLAAILGSAVQMYLYFGPLIGDALRSRMTMDATYLLVLAVGCLLALPLLGAEILPDWCTEPFRLLFAALDGLFDAIPGIAVMTTGAVLAGGFYRNQFSSTEAFMEAQHVAGALVLAFAEIITIPLLLILFLRWASKEIEADAQGRISPVGPPAEVVLTEELSQVDRPWWETEGGPRRTDEYRGR